MNEDRWERSEKQRSAKEFARKEVATKTKGNLEFLETYTSDIKYCSLASSSCDHRFHTAVKTAPAHT
jgi:hypothetical protein